MSPTGPSRLEGPIRSLAVVYREDTDEVLAITERLRAWANDAGLSGGEEQAITLDLTHYYSSNLRFQFGWTNILDTKGGSATTAEAEGIDILSFRAQLTF